MKPILALLVCLTLMCGCSSFTAAPGEAVILAGQVQQVVVLASEAPQLAAVPAVAGVVDAVYGTCGNGWEFLIGKKKLSTTSPFAAQLAAFLDDAKSDGTLTEADAATVNQLAAVSLECIQADVAGVPYAASTSAPMVAKVKALAPKRVRVARAALPPWLTQIIGKLPSGSQAAANAWVAQYGTEFIGMGAQAVEAAFAALIAGDQYAPYSAVLKQMTRVQKDADFAVKVQQFIGTTATDAARVQEARQGLLAAIQAAFAALITMIGL